jgi:hypothetical protein
MTLNIKQPRDYSTKESDVFAFLTLHGTQRVVGTASVKEIDYAADYDLMEYIHFGRSEEVYELILTLFREKFRTAHKSKTIWLTDFKCGVLAGGKPIRWKKEDLDRGFQIIEDNKIYFVECLQEQSVIKLDAIVLINGLFHEFSEIYLMSFGDFKTYNPITTKAENIEVALLRDVKHYTEKGNYYKALKRLFAYLRISGKNAPLLQELTDYFNSSVGELASYKSDLELVSIMLGQSFRPVKHRDIIYNIKYIEKHINPSFKDLVKSIIREKTDDRIKKHTEEVEEILNSRIQEETKKFIATNKKIYSYIRV